MKVILIFALLLVYLLTALAFIYDRYQFYICSFLSAWATIVVVYVMIKARSLTDNKN